MTRDETFVDLLAMLEQGGIMGVDQYTFLYDRPYTKPVQREHWYVVPEDEAEASDLEDCESVADLGFSEPFRVTERDAEQLYQHALQYDVPEQVRQNIDVILQDFSMNEEADEIAKRDGWRDPLESIRSYVSDLFGSEP